MVVGGVVVVDFLGDIGVVAVGVIDCHSYYDNRLMMTKPVYQNTNDTILNISLIVAVVVVVVVVMNGIRISSVSYVYNPGWTFVDGKIVVCCRSII